MDFSFQSQNGCITYNGLDATFHRVGANYICISYSEVDLEPFTLHESEFESLFLKSIHPRSNKKKSSSVYKELTHKQHDIIAWRKTCVKKLFEKVGNNKVGGKKIREELAACLTLQYQKPVSAASLARWANLEMKHELGVAADLFSRSNSRASSYYPQEVIDLALGTIDDYFLVPNLPTIENIYIRFKKTFLETFEKDQDLPSSRTFYRWIQKFLDPMNSLIKKHGKHTSRQMLRNAVKMLVVGRPLERVEVDAIHVNIGLIDNEGHYLGKPIFFVAIDCCTRAILGIEMYIGEGERSESVQNLLRHCMLPKDHEKEGDWPMFGQIERIYNDGGPAFTSVQTVSFGNYYNCTMVTVPTGQGACKPYIERFFGTMRQRLLRNIPSYMGKFGDKSKHDVSLQKQAVFKPEDLLKLVKKWIVEDYHHTPHHGLNRETPYKTWRTLCKLYPPVLPSKYRELRELREHVHGEQRWATIQGEHFHKGVTINRIRYNDEDDLLKKIGMRYEQMNQPALVECYYSTNDVGRISVIDPFMNITFIVPAVHRDDLQGMSLAEFNAKYPSSYIPDTEKHMPVVFDDPLFLAAEEASKAKLKTKSSRKQRSVRPEVYEEGINLLAEKAMSFDQVIENNTNHDSSDALSMFNIVDFNNLDGHDHV